MNAAVQAGPAATAKPYDDEYIRWFTIAAVFWGIAGFLVGLYLALELAFPGFNLGLEWVNFGRLRPVHTSAVIFAFGGNVLIGTSFYVVQRTCRTSLWGGERLAAFGYRVQRIQL